MTPRLLVLSDLHIAPPGPLANFHSAEALAAFLHTRAATPSTTLILAGDVLDFLQLDRPAHLDMPAAPALLKRLLSGLAADPQRAGILDGLRAALDAGAECVVMPGNHDPELHHPACLDVLRRALGTPPGTPSGDRLSLHLDDAPWTATLGHLQVVVGHGHRADRWNDIDPAAVRRAIETGDSKVRLPPGSRLVTEVLRSFQLAVDARSGAPRFPFVDLLKPELPAVALLLWYLDPGLAGARLGGVLGLSVEAVLRPLERLLRRGPVLGGARGLEALAVSKGGVSAGGGDDSEALAAGVAAALWDELTAEERASVGATLRRATSWMEGQRGGLEAMGTLAPHSGFGRRAVRGYLRRVSQQGAFFDVRAASAEDGAIIDTHLPEGARGRVAIFGHTHAARDLRLPGDRTYLNTGTWIDLMELPPLADDAAVQGWIDALEEGRVPRLQRLTYAEVDASGASLRTWQWPPRPVEVGVAAVAGTASLDAASCDAAALPPDGAGAHETTLAPAYVSPAAPVLFVSSADADKLWWASFEKHAAQWERSGAVRLVHASRFRAGARHREELDAALESAAGVVLLVSADYLASEACVAEAARAIARAARGEARVVPVLVRSCNIAGARFEGLKPLPRNATPVSAWSDRDAAWTDVIAGLREALSDSRRS